MVHVRCVLRSAAGGRARLGVTVKTVWMRKRKTVGGYEYGSSGHHDQGCAGVGDGYDGR